MNYIGEYIRKYRGDMSLREFAKKCDISHTHLDSIEKGIDPRTGKPVRITVETLKKIAKTMGMSINDLLIQSGDVKLNDLQFDNNIIKINNFFGTNLKYLREQHNYTKKELADKLKVNQSTIARWENNEMSATVDNAYDVASFFNITVDDLTGIDLKKKSINPMDELELLFSKNKDILTDDDKEYIKFIIEKRKKEIDNQ